MLLSQVSHSTEHFRISQSKQASHSTEATMAELERKHLLLLFALGVLSKGFVKVLFLSICTGASCIEAHDLKRSLSA